MIIETTTTPRRPRCWIVFDLESAVLDETAHKRYQMTERWAPSGDQPSRRGYTRSEDPLRTPRWPFQTITTAALIMLVEHADGNIDVSRFVTLSAPEHDEREVISGVLQVLEEAPAGAEICSWSGMMHDVPLLIAGCMRYGLTLPSDWKWLSFGGSNASRHLDLARAITGGFKMKPVHMAEILAAMDLPAKLSAPAFAIAKLIGAGRWEIVQEACEGDVISTALLLARWRKLLDPRIDADVVEDRILRRVIELRTGRGYVPALTARRDARFRAKISDALNDADALAPWLDLRAA